MKKLPQNPKDIRGTKKVSISKVPPASIIYEALAMENGGNVYGPYNWRDNAVVAFIYYDAAMRHLMKWWDREELDTDSLLPHLAHAKACIGILIDALESGNLIDDRPKPGPAAKLLKRYIKK